MAGRPKHYQDEELIDQATKVFWQKGFTAASAQDLMKAMDIGQGSFYRAFPGGKKDLYKRSLNRFMDRSIKQFYQKLESSEDTIGCIKDFFAAIPNRTVHQQNNGCYLGNAIVELSNLDEETKKMSSTLMAKLQAGFVVALVRAQKEGKLAVDKSPEVLALYLINLWNGINVTQRMGIPKTQIDEVLKLSLQILG